MTFTENKTNIYDAATKRQNLTMSEISQVHGACAVNSDDCCHPGAYKSGDYKITRIGFLTIKKYEYFCPMCETFFWMTDYDLFD